MNTKSPKTVLVSGYNPFRNVAVLNPVSLLSEATNYSELKKTATVTLNQIECHCSMYN
jgi:hypothetical protein